MKFFFKECRVKKFSGGIWTYSRVSHASPSGMAVEDRQSRCHQAVASHRAYRNAWHIGSVS